MHIYDVLHSAMTVSGGGFPERVADLAVTAIWQGASIACGLALCLRLAPGVSAAHRFKIWTAAFFTLVSLPFLAMAADLPLRTASAASFGNVGATAGPWLKFDARWSLVIAGLWALSSLVRAADLMIHAAKLRTIWKDATPVEADVQVSAALVRVNGRVEVCTTRALDRPSVIGFFKPRILIPDWLFARLTAGELEQIVMHEAEHLRRRDDWTNLLQKLCLVVFPLNPALVWIERRLCREREMACDEGVIRMTRAPRAYAACLASLAERGLERRAAALSLGAWQRRPELVHRVHSILRGKGGLSQAAARMLLGTVGCGLLTGSVALARCPQLVAFVPERSAARTVEVASGEDSVSTIAAREAARMGHPQSGHSQNANLVRLVSYSPTHAAKESAWMGHPNSAGQPASVPVALKTAAVDRRNHAPRAQMLKAKMPDAKTPVTEQEWVVLTTWQVETTNPNAGVTSDYDASAGAEQKTDGNDADAQKGAEQNAQPTNRITVTRLILRVLPANAASNSANTTSNSSTNPATGEPGVTAVRGGWLVFQL